MKGGWFRRTFSRQQTHRSALVSDSEAQSHGRFSLQQGRDAGLSRRNDSGEAIQSDNGYGIKELERRPVRPGWMVDFKPVQEEPDVDSENLPEQSRQDRRDHRKKDVARDSAHSPRKRTPSFSFFKRPKSSNDVTRPEGSRLAQQDRSPPPVPHLPRRINGNGVNMNTEHPSASLQEPSRFPQNDIVDPRFSASSPIQPQNAQYQYRLNAPAAFPFREVQSPLLTPQPSGVSEPFASTSNHGQGSVVVPVASSRTRVGSPNDVGLMHALRAQSSVPPSAEDHLWAQASVGASTLSGMGIPYGSLQMPVINSGHSGGVITSRPGTAFNPPTPAPSPPPARASNINFGRDSAGPYVTGSQRGVQAQQNPSFQPMSFFSSEQRTSSTPHPVSRSRSRAANDGNENRWRPPSPSGPSQSTLDAMISETPDLDLTDKIEQLTEVKEASGSSYDIFWGRSTVHRKKVVVRRIRCNIEDDEQFALVMLII